MISDQCLIKEKNRHGKYLAVFLCFEEVTFGWGLGPPEIRRGPVPNQHSGMSLSPTTRPCPRLKSFFHDGEEGFGGGGQGEVAAVDQA